MGNSETVSMEMQQAFGEENLDVIHVSDADADLVNQFDNLIIGGSTWGTGEIQDDMEDFLKVLDDVDMSKKQVALFGLGDQLAYPLEFANSLGDLYDDMIGRKANVIGEWPTDGYDYKKSKAERHGKFVGLVLDVDNQPDITRSRIDEWAEQLKKLFKSRMAYRWLRL